MAAERMTVLELATRGIREGEYFTLEPKKNLARFAVFLHTRKGKVFRIEATADVKTFEIFSSGCP